MRIEEIRRYIRQQPFAPFRVFISDGSRYDVRHPDFILLSRQAVEIGIGRSAEDYPERIVTCDPVHITRIARISEPRGSNGRKKKP